MKRLFEGIATKAAENPSPKLPTRRMLFAAGTEEAIDGGVTLRSIRYERRISLAAERERRKLFAQHKDPFDSDSDTTDKENSNNSPYQIRYQTHSPHHTPIPVKVPTLK